MGRKKYSKKLKIRIAFYTIKDQKKIAELASEYGVPANQKSIWKKQLLDAARDAFSGGKEKGAEKKEVECDRLYQRVGQLQIKVDRVKKTVYLGRVSQRKSNMITGHGSFVSLSTFRRSRISSL